MGPLEIRAQEVNELDLPSEAAAPEGVADAADTEAESRGKEDPVVTEKRPRGIEQITVTARKREEALQATPISMVAFGEDELEARQITTITDIGEAVPNLKFDTANGSNNQSRIYIRGVGQDDFRSNVDPGVGLYIDGVYIPRLTGSVVSTLDLENVQVLRGPQGTLFGKNTVGGVIDLTTRKPEPEFGGNALVRFGSFGRFDTQATLNVPLIPETLLTRFVLETQTDEGYTRNSFNDTKTGDNKLLKGRFATRWMPTDLITVDLAYEQTREDEKAPTPECRLGNSFSPGRFYTDNLASGFVSACQSDTADGSDLTAGSDFDQKTDLNTRFAYGTITWDLDDFTVKSISSWRRIDTRTSRADLDASFVDAFGVGSLTSENDAISQELQLAGTGLDDRLAYTAGIYGFKESGHTRTTLSALSNAISAVRAGRDIPFPGVLIAGATLPDPTTGTPIPLAFLLSLLTDQNGNPIPVGPELTLAQFDALVGGFGRITDPTASLTPSTDALFQLNQTLTERFETWSVASFAEATYDLTDQLSMTGGIRYTKERKERQGKFVRPADAALLNLGDAATRTVSGSPIDDRFDKWTGRVQLEYQATDEVFTYATYSRGFKSGGFNLSVDDPLDPDDNDPGKFDQEVLDSYEIGVKTQWLDNRLVLNLSAFYNEYDDIQLTTIQLDPDGIPRGQINNVAEATIKGFEFDFQFQPMPELTFSGGLGMTEADYGGFKAREDAADALQRFIAGNPSLAGCNGLNGTTCPDAGQFIQLAAAATAPDLSGVAINPAADFSDLERTNTPNFNANLSVDYLLDLSTWGTMTARATYFVQGDVEYVTFNDDEIRQNRFGLLNGRLAWDLWDGRTTVALFGRNLFDRRYINGGFSLNDTNGVKTVFYGRPRTLGLEIMRRF